MKLLTPRPSNSANGSASWILISSTWSRRAAEKLRELAEQPAAQSALGKALSRLLLGADTPYEVREVCEALLRSFRRRKTRPTRKSRRPKSTHSWRNPTLTHTVNGSAHTTRLGWAAKRGPELARLVAEKIQRRLADVNLSRDARVRLAAVREVAWLAWLASDPATWPAPTATEEAMQGWIKTLASRTEWSRRKTSPKAN